MKHIFTTYSLQLIKENSSLYEVEKRMNSPKDIAKVLCEVMNLDKQAEEVLCLICLNTKNSIIGLFEVHRGSLNSSIVHPREVFKRALLANSASIIIAHNHPSGDSQPSKEDISITERLKESSKVIGIDLLDHIIIGSETSYCSFKEKGLF